MDGRILRKDGHR